MKRERLREASRTGVRRSQGVLDAPVATPRLFHGLNCFATAPLVCGIAPTTQWTQHAERPQTLRSNMFN